MCNEVFSKSFSGGWVITSCKINESPMSCKFNTNKRGGERENPVLTGIWRDAGIPSTLVKVSRKGNLLDLKKKNLGRVLR